MELKNYKGATCASCGILVSIGSKRGFCRNCYPRRRLSTLEKETISARMMGNVNGSFITEENRKKISLMQKGNKWCVGRKPWNKDKPYEQIRGDKHPNWKGGISPLNKIFRHSVEYKLWRKAVFVRDDYTCVLCTVRSSKGNPVVLNADHIKAFSLFPELRLELSNGRTLCVPCHKKTPNFAGRIHRHAVI